MEIPTKGVAFARMTQVCKLELGASVMALLCCWSSAYHLAPNCFKDESILLEFSFQVCPLLGRHSSF